MGGSAERIALSSEPQERQEYTDRPFTLFYINFLPSPPFTFLYPSSSLLCLQHLTHTSISDSFLLPLSLVHPQSTQMPDFLYIPKQNWLFAGRLWKIYSISLAVGGPLCFFQMIKVNLCLLRETIKTCGAVEVWLHSVKFGSKCS